MKEFLGGKKKGRKEEVRRYVALDGDPSFFSSFGGSVAPLLLLSFILSLYLFSGLNSNVFTNCVLFSFPLYLHDGCLFTLSYDGEMMVSSPCPFSFQG